MTGDFLGLELKIASQKELAKKEERGILFSLETWGLAWPQAP